MSNAMVKGDSAAGEIVRQGFGETSIERRGETASTMLAAQAQAEIQARYIVALQRPRNDDTVRVKLLQACDRLLFAQRAYYAVPRSGLKKPGRITGTRGVIEGLSVRFAELAIRVSGNILQKTRAIYDDDFKRMINVAATDLETNAVYERDVLIEKTIERSEPREGQVVLGSRENSAGNKVFIIQASEEELLQKESALISRVFRTLALRLVAPDVLEECEQRIATTVARADKADPEGARKTLVDNFAKLGVMPDSLVLYLGHPISECSPAEMMELRGLYAAVHDGEITMAAAVAEKTGEVAKDETPADATTKASSVAAKIKERAKKIADAKAAKQPPGATPAPAAAKPTAGSDDALFGARPAAPAAKPTPAADEADPPPPDDYPDGDPDRGP